MRHPHRARRPAAIELTEFVHLETSTGKSGGAPDIIRLPQSEGENGLARIIHDGSSRNRAIASRDGRPEPRGPEAYLNSTSRV
jgi:hypothetical protein